MKEIAAEQSQMATMAQNSRRLFTEVLYRSGRVIAQNLCHLQFKVKQFEQVNVTSKYLSTATAHKCKIDAVQHMTSQLIQR